LPKEKNSPFLRRGEKSAPGFAQPIFAVSVMSEKRPSLSGEKRARRKIQRSLPPKKEGGGTIVVRKPQEKEKVHRQRISETGRR